ncbi:MULTISPECIES: thiamine kinase [unclassified Erwinia]|uniref:thiamine kinase n=1 Tax=unclassified Erwinia TaxID=2622719 RepID=UPI000C177574|nr:MULTISPECIES: thiamine kinase [unclassified Erwinia]
MYRTEPGLARLVSQQFPAAQAAGSVSLLQGLTGLTYQLVCDDQRLIARRQPADQQYIPGVCRQREYRLLRKLAASGLVPVALGWQSPWLLLSWRPGESTAALPAADFEAGLLPLLCHLHRQSPVGFPLNLPALLWRYWQLCHPRDKTPRWLAELKKLARQGTPDALRNAPLHLDIHRGNLLQTDQGLSLIDWEYAADGDIALELCMLHSTATVSAAGWGKWLDAYASTMALDRAVLAAQIERWRPWVRLLMASWYTLRYQQRQDAGLKTLARDAWHLIETA